MLRLAVSWVRYSVVATGLLNKNEVENLKKGWTLNERYSMIDCKCKATNVSKYGNMSNTAYMCLLNTFSIKFFAREISGEPRVVQGLKKSSEESSEQVPVFYKPSPRAAHPPTPRRLGFLRVWRFIGNILGKEL